MVRLRGSLHSFEYRDRNPFIGFDVPHYSAFDGASLLFLFLFAAIWSLMRCAALPGYERLSIFIEKVPFFGRVFERLFRPDTYYRQDSQKMYQKVFDLAITETIAAVTTPQGLRNAGVDGSPVVADLHWK